ncbi:Aste57867_14223 [Aphanomyces stellatus]|uniref:Aste57867_14223 protein n=1 Tax=Aphanomyces stellatus TaxID=120398 RepID=A0A485L158_9STRA|nr:hypothetical protein As57867_014172 [Aphanomyces stellatus]VFT91048.1 Aste57867_14223 [Aphanomyces stellatus]
MPPAAAARLVRIKNAHPVSSTPQDWFHRAAGVLYLIVSACLTLHYLSLLDLYLENDYFWTSFNASGAQTFVADVYNHELWLLTTTTLPLFAIDGARTSAAYGSPTAHLTIPDTAARRIAMEELRTLPQAILGLRSQSVDQSTHAMTSYCWLDFNHVWEVAHTAARQARCRASYAANGAVYMEAMLRNTVWSTWMQTWGALFQTAYGNVLATTPAGVAWLRQTSSAMLRPAPIASEVAFWRGFDVTTYVLPWHNRHVGGFDNAIVVANAVQSFSIPLHHVDFSRRSGLWTSFLASYGVYNDLYYVSQNNVSLVRNHANESAPFLDDSLERWSSDYTGTPWIALLHSNVGPLGSIDVFYVRPPPSLVQAYHLLHTALIRTVQTHAIVNHAYQRHPGLVTLGFLPPAWTTTTNFTTTVAFHGGNLLCTAGDAQAFPQQSVGFDDACTAPFPRLTIDASALNAALALVLVQSTTTTSDSRQAQIARTCALVDKDDVIVCAKAMAATHALVDAWVDAMSDHHDDDVTTWLTTTATSAAATATLEDVLALDIGLMQYARVNATPTILHQPLLGDRPWSFFGWLHLIAWLDGSREVLSFEGDVDMFTLISKAYEPQTMAANSLETPNRFAYVLTLLVYYKCLVSATVASVAVVCALVARGVFYGPNLFFFHPVVGTVWCGRPLLVVRGITAMIVLSAANVRLAVVPGGLTRFVVTDRSFVDAAVVAGETLWLTYALHDLFSAVPTRHARCCLVAAAAVVWATTLAMDLGAPIQPSATLARTCSSSNMDAQVTCVSGQVSIGSSERFVMLGLIHAVAIVATQLVGRVLDRRFVAPNDTTTTPPVVVPAIAAQLFVNDYRLGPYGDSTTNVLSGLIPFRVLAPDHIFSVVLWMWITTVGDDAIDVFRGPTSTCGGIGKDRRSAAKSAVVIVPYGPTCTTRTSASLVWPSSMSNHLARVVQFVPTMMPLVPSTQLLPSALQVRALASIGFLLGSAISTAGFFYVVQEQLGNDFLWQGFNHTGLQPFLMDWYNAELTLAPIVNDTALSISRATQRQFYNTSTPPTVTSSVLYASVMQFDHLSLLQTVHGLRRMDACELPWVATQYCYVDFARRWEVATSDVRQQRCHTQYVANAAVYIEPILRNADAYTLQSCWGASLERGLLQDLRQSTAGQAFLAASVLTTGAPLLAPPDEVAYWSMTHHMTSYTTQWQNYKSLGVVESVSIVSAFGLAYPLTLKASSGASRLALQTSLKMYWGWASDLWVIGANETTSVSGGGSLIRSSATFAFANTSHESIVLANQSLGAPLDPGLALVRAAVGPFGGIDLVHVPVPPSLAGLYQAFLDAYTTILTSSTAAANSPLLGVFAPIYEVPTAWLVSGGVTRGGNLLCPANSASLALSMSVLTWMSATASCDSVLSEVLYVNHLSSVVALVAWGAMEPCLDLSPTCRSVQDACTTATATATACLGAIPPVQGWITSYMAPHLVTQLHDRAQTVQLEIAAMDIQVAQYAQANASSPLTLLRLNVLDESDPSFQLFGWYLLVDWVLGHREVVSLQGDVSTVTLLSYYAPHGASVPNALEIPRNVAYYCALCLQYTTLMVFLVTFFSLVYAFAASGGRIEGLNMIEVNRVGGVVWVGRPLLFLRSVVAILFLSTATAQLEIAGVFTRLVTDTTTRHVGGIPTWGSTVVASLETCWLVIVVTDLFMVVTKDHTNAYSFKSAVVTTVGTILLSVLAPIEPTFVLRRACHAVHLDLQLACDAGVIQIGDYGRTVQLGVMTSVVAFVCYIVEYARDPAFKLPPHQPSLLLPAGAFYLYHKGPWIIQGTLYLDKVSAFLCGLVTFTYHDTVYLLDIKTWRLHVVPCDDSIQNPALFVHAYDHRRFASAVAMVD